MRETVSLPDRRPVDLGEVGADLPGCQPAGGQRQHELVDALQAPLPLLDDRRLERALPVARDVDLHRTDLGDHGLGAGAVAFVGAGLALPVPGLIAQVLGELFLQCELQDLLGQTGQQPVGPDRPTPDSRAWATICRANCFFSASSSAMGSIVSVIGTAFPPSTCSACQAGPRRPFL